MSFLPILIDSGFSTRDTTATGKGRINFIIGDKLAYNGRHRHSALIFSEWQIKLIQPLFQAVQLMIVEP